MAEEQTHREHLRFLQKLGTHIRLHEIGIIDEPLPENIKVMLLHMKRAEREREQGYE